MCKRQINQALYHFYVLTKTKSSNEAADQYLSVSLFGFNANPENILVNAALGLNHIESLWFLNLALFHVTSHYSHFSYFNVMLEMSFYTIDLQCIHVDFLMVPSFGLFAFYLPPRIATKWTHLWPPGLDFIFPKQIWFQKSCFKYSS